MREWTREKGRKGLWSTDRRRQKGWRGWETAWRTYPVRVSSPVSWAGKPRAASVHPRPTSAALVRVLTAGPRSTANRAGIKGTRVRALSRQEQQELPTRSKKGKRQMGKRDRERDAVESDTMQLRRQ